MLKGIGQRRWFWPVLALAVCSGCEQEQAGKKNKNPRVVVTKPATTTVMDYRDFTGRLEAVKTVDVRARVSGYVTKAPGKEKGVVQEGEIVQAGELLFQIDIRPYEEDYNLAVANLKVAMAEHNLQIRNAARAKELLPANAISKEDYETVLANMDKAEANVGALKAARDRAKLYMDYTHVTAPVTGRVSRRHVDPGNLINADMTVLTTIVTEDPMYAYFDVDERTFLDLLAIIAPGKASWSEGLKLPVLMRLANENEYEKIGKVDFVDNRVVATSGTVRMRGVFDNANLLLKPGLFVRIRLPLGSPYPALVIPDEAILSDQEKKYVWVVNAKSEVEYRSVKVGQATKELRVIKPPEKGFEGKEGLSKDDQVIVSGTQRVRKGSLVETEAMAPLKPVLTPLVKLFAHEPSEATANGNADAANRPTETVGTPKSVNGGQ
jgi:RND family efflux transporter MFP subunit